jgi:hypothetical protein
MQIDRRSFIKGLIAAAALPPILRSLPIEKLEPTAEIWQVIEENPAVFYIRSGSTIDTEEYIPPTTRGEAFDVANSDLNSRDALLDRANEIQPIMWELQRQYDNFRGKIVDDDNMDIEDWPEEADEEVIEKWFAQMSDEHFSNVCTAMRQWTESEPDWLNEENEYFTIAAGGQEYALDFFENYVGQEILEELEIEIVEGDRPGSSYFAAELHIPIEQANERAIAAGIPVRFVSN